MRRSPSESNGKLLMYNAKKITIQPIRLESDKQHPEKGMQTKNQSALTYVIASVLTYVLASALTYVLAMS
jgi:hypothetical protein